MAGPSVADPSWLVLGGSCLNWLVPLQLVHSTARASMAGTSAADPSAACAFPAGPYTARASRLNTPQLMPQRLTPPWLMPP